MTAPTRNLLIECAQRLPEVSDEVLPPMARLILLCLADGAATNAQRQTWKGPDAIARWTGLDVDTVRTWLRALREAGWITAEPRKGDNGAQLSNMLTVGNLDGAAVRLKRQGAHHAKTPSTPSLPGTPLPARHPPPCPAPPSLPEQVPPGGAGPMPPSLPEPHPPGVPGTPQSSQGSSQGSSQPTSQDPPPPPRGGGDGSAVVDGAEPKPRTRKRTATAAPSSPAPDEGGDPRAKRVPEHIRRYATAFAAGISAATGAPFPEPVDSLDRKLFVEALPVYALDAGGEKLRGDGLDGWIRWSAEMYARATLHRGSLHGGLNVRRWADWLKAGEHLKPCVRVGFFGGDALQVYAGIYKLSARNYGAYVSTGDDDREAARIAEELCAKVLAHAAEHGIEGSTIRDLVVKNMELWSKQYLRLDGWNGGTQYVDQGHRFQYLGKNIALYGTTWEPKGVSGAGQRGGARRGVTRQMPAGEGEFDWRKAQRPEGA